MTKKDINHLWKFVLRTAMYTGKENQDCIVSYLHGYEDAADEQCNFIALLSDSIVKDYDIEPSASNWIGQIEAISRESNTDWIIIFKRESLKILVPRLDENSRKEFQYSFRKRIVGKISGLENHFDKDWIIDWFGLCNVSVRWFKSMWAEKELALIQEIDLELKGYGNINLIEKRIHLTDKLRLTCKDLLNSINLSS